MPGRRPIFASLITGFFGALRDILYRLILEPESHEKRNQRKNKSK